MRSEKKWIWVLLASGLLGSAFQPGVGCLHTLARNFNPCGTVLICYPIEYDLLFHKFPDYNIDPTCTIPVFCGGVFPGTPATRGGQAAPQQQQGFGGVQQQQQQQQNFGGGGIQGGLGGGNVFGG